MANFIKDSLAELEHVVWPTHIETKKFFQIVVIVLIAMTLFTWLLTLAFSNAFFGIRKVLHATPQADISASPVINTAPLEVKTTTDGGAVTVSPVSEVPAQ